MKNTVLRGTCNRVYVDNSYTFMHLCRPTCMHCALFSKRHHKLAKSTIHSDPQTGFGWLLLVHNWLSYDMVEISISMLVSPPWFEPSPSLCRRAQRRGNPHLDPPGSDRKPFIYRWGLPQNARNHHHFFRWKPSPNGSFGIRLPTLWHSLILLLSG